MKTDLDRIMLERNLDALLVLGDSDSNKVMNYLTAGAHLEGAMIVKRRGAPLTLIHGAMERDTAAATGMRLIDRDEHYNRYLLLKEHKGDRLTAQIDYMRRVVRDLELSGRLGIYGAGDIGANFTLLNHLQDSLVDVELVGEYEESLFSQLRETKDNQEIAHLQEAGRLTSIVVGETQEYIQRHQTRNEIVVRGDGEPLTIGDVKAFLRGRLFHYSLKENHDTIFSQGRDAGVPHNRGNDIEPLRLGQSIIFDIFPYIPSGYYHDMTRTWSLGYASDEVQQAYDHCKEIFDRVMGLCAVGQECKEYQLFTAQYFESMGHKTPISHPGTKEGYVHSLGHGIGLDIHEEPRLSHADGNLTRLQPGHVVSVEPGLYYPERGFGVRIEDSIAFDEAGKLINLTNYPYDLVVPMRK